MRSAFFIFILCKIITHCVESSLIYKLKASIEEVFFHCTEGHDKFCPCEEAATFDVINDSIQPITINFTELKA